MPVTVVKRGAKYRVVEADTKKIAATPNGKARDGGGHADQAKASRQARAINASLARKR